MFKTKFKAGLGLAISVAVALVMMPTNAAQAETDAQAVVGSSGVFASRPVTSGGFNVYKGDSLNVSWSASPRGADLAALSLQAGDVIGVNLNATATLGASVITGSTFVSINVQGAGGASSFVYNTYPANTVTIPSDWTSVLSVSYHVNATVASTQNTGRVTLSPTVTRLRSGSTVSATVGTSDVDTDVSMDSMLLGTADSGVAARLGDATVDVMANRVCVKLSGLQAGDVLQASMTATKNGASVSSGATFMPHWSTTASMSTVSTSTYTLPDGINVATDKVGLSAQLHISDPTAGTYKMKTLSIVKQGTTENLVTSCGTTPAKVTSATVVKKLVTVNVNPNGDTSNHSFACTLYKSTDKTHKTPLYHSTGSGMNKCYFQNVAAGKYTASLRGMGGGGAPGTVNGLSAEKFGTSTITVK